MYVYVCVRRNRKISFNKKMEREKGEGKKGVRVCEKREKLQDDGEGEKRGEGRRE